MAIIGRQAAGTLGLSLIVEDVTAATAFYRDVLGATVTHGQAMPSAGGSDRARLGPDSARLRLGDVHLTVVRENPRPPAEPKAKQLRSPKASGMSAVALTLYVDDVDDVFAQALAAGATLHGESGAPQNTAWGDRVAQFWDPFGHFWRVQTRLHDISEADLADAHLVGLSGAEAPFQAGEPSLQG